MENVLITLDGIGIIGWAHMTECNNLYHVIFLMGTLWIQTKEGGRLEVL